MNVVNAVSSVPSDIQIAINFLERLTNKDFDHNPEQLLNDKITWKYNNQVSLLVKANNACEGLGMNTEGLPMKMLTTLLDHAGDEDNANMQEKWVNLILNMADKPDSINHIYPHLLSQVSLSEYNALEATWKAKLERVYKLNQESTVFAASYPEVRHKYMKELEILSNNKTAEYFQLSQKLKELDSKAKRFKNAIAAPQPVIATLEKSAVYNLLRLGLIREELSDCPDFGIENESTFFLTELGELLVKNCN